MSLDAIIIADYGESSLSGSSPLRLSIEGETADIQTVLNYLKNDGKLVFPIEGNGITSWASAPKLNGIYLYSYLTSNNFNVALIDNYASERDAFRDFLRESPKAIIISTTFIYIKEELRKLIEEIRSLAPDVFIIAGGPFVYLSYLILNRSNEQIYQTKNIKNDFLFFKQNEPSVDLYIISPRGENILCDVLDRLKKDGKVGDHPNTARLIGKKYYFTQYIDDIPTVNNFTVDWGSLPESIYRTGVVPMQASTGCPHKCAFCNFVKNRRIISVKPLDELIGELKAASKRGAQYVWFVDDNFRLGKNDLNSVCRRFIEEDLQITWMSFIRADTLNNVDFELLHQSGCKEMRLGLESSDLQILNNMNKKVDADIASEVVKKLLAVGINCTCYFIIGFPGETRDTAFRTLEFIKGIENPELPGMLSWSLYPFMLAPMSPIFESEMRRKYDMEGYMLDWEHSTMTSQEAHELVLKFFLELENSGPIYRGDNLSILLNLTPEQRNKFVTIRHKLSKLAINNQLRETDIIREFSNILLT